MSEEGSGIAETGAEPQAHLVQDNPTAPLTLVCSLPLRVCRHCGLPYHWLKSRSSVRLTYCGILCEIGDLGFSVEALEKAEPGSPGSGGG